MTIACLEIGAIPVMALPAFRKAELEYLVSFSDAKAIAIAPEYRGFDHAALARDLNPRLILSTTPAAGCVSMHEHVRVIACDWIFGSGDPFDVALFLLSGGTTGVPKLIPRTHADYLYNARESAAATGLTSESRILIALPAEHNFPLACPGLLGALLIGARAVFTQSSKAADLANIIERERITHLPCVPALAIALLDLPQSSRSQLASLRVITVGGQRLQEPTARALKRAFPHLVVQQVLGMAEGLAVLHAASTSAKKSPSRRKAVRSREPTRSESSTPTAQTSRPARLANYGVAVHTRFAATSARRIAIAKRSPPMASTAPATWCDSLRPGISWSREESKT